MNPVDPPKDIAAECKSLITGLLISATSSVSVRELCNDFYMIVGYPIPFAKLGFRNVELYLQSIPDTVQIHGSGMMATVRPVVKASVAHINEMVCKQKKHAPKRVQRRSPRCPSLNYAANRSYTTRSRDFRPPRYHQSSSSVDHQPIPPLLSVPSVAFSDRCIPNTNNTSSNDTAVSPPVVANSAQEKTVEKIIEQPPASGYSLLDELRNCHTNNEKTNTEDATNVDPLPKPILKKVIEKQIEVMPEVVSGNTYTKWSNAEEGFDITRKILDQKTTPIDLTTHCKVPKDIQLNLTKVIENFPNGILCSKLPPEYRKLFGRGLHYEKYHYRSLIEMISDLPEIFHYVQSSSADFLIFDKNVNLPITGPLTDLVNGGSPHLSQNLVTSSILDEIQDLSWENAKLLLPPDVMGPDDVIPRYFIEDEKENDYLDINIGDIYDPSKFWMNLRLGPLENLMKEIQQHFSNPKNMTTIPEKLLVEGLFCATPYYDEIHRAVIVNILPEVPDEVKVFYVDYGTVGYTKIEQVYFLHKSFGEVPTQAIRARLSNIYPPVENAPWSIECTNKFKNMAYNRFLIAEIIKIDREDLILEVYLVDITKKNNITFVNDRLTNEGFAKFIGQETKKPIPDSECIPRQDYIHLFPEFDEIENGLAPTSDEMLYIFKNDVSIDHYYPQYYERASCEDIQYADRMQEVFDSNCKKIRTIEGIKFEEDLDFSLFPESIVKEMKNIAHDLSKKEKNRKERTSKNSEENIKNDVKKVEDASKPVANGGISGFCNRNRIEEYLKSDEIEVTLDSLEDFNPFKRFSVKDLPKIQAVNPFLVSDSDSVSEHSPNNNSNPFMANGVSSDMEMSSDSSKIGSLSPPTAEIVQYEAPKAAKCPPPPGFGPNPSFGSSRKQPSGVNPWVGATLNYNNFYSTNNNSWNPNMQQMPQMQPNFGYNPYYGPQFLMNMMPQMNFPNPMMGQFPFPGNQHPQMNPNFWQNNRAPFYPRNN